MFEACSDALSISLLSFIYDDECFLVSTDRLGMNGIHKADRADGTYGADGTYRPSGVREPNEIRGADQIRGPSGTRGPSGIYGPDGIRSAIVVSLIIRNQGSLPLQLTHQTWPTLEISFYRRIKAGCLLYMKVH